MGKKIALALGSGGARGYAHIGVIREIERQGHEIVAIAGTSSGALVGGVYAAGGLDEFTDWVTSFSQRDVLMLLDPVLKGPGAIRAEKVMSVVRKILQGKRIEDLNIEYTAIATDLYSAREVWFKTGPLHAAIRASIAIPSLITPANIDGRVMIDGGLLNPVPVAPLASANADLIVAVNASAHGHEKLSSTLVAESNNQNHDEIERLLSVPSDVSTFQILMKSMDVVQNSVTRYQLANHPPDVLIEIPMSSCGMLEFYRAKEMIQLGEELTKEKFR